MPASRLRKGVLWTLGFVLAVILLLAVAGFLMARSFTSGPAASDLATIRDFPITLSDGRRSVLRDRVRPGLPTVISLWASWCGPCRQEAPVLSDLRRRFGKERMNFVYLNVREPEATRQDLTGFAESVGIAPEDYAIAQTRDLPKLTNDTTNLIPRTYVFDRTGKPLAMIVGYKPLALARVEGLLR